MADFDSPWKEALDVYYPAFLLLFFPDIHADIDWSRPVERLDKEFQQLVPRAAQGRRTVDKLVKVWRNNGRAAWVLVHVEVQAQRDRAFTRRLCTYNCRIFDAHERDVATLAVLDERFVSSPPVQDRGSPTRQRGFDSNPLAGASGCPRRLDERFVSSPPVQDRGSQRGFDSNPSLAHRAAPGGSMSVS